MNYTELILESDGNRSHPTFSYTSGEYYYYSYTKVHNFNSSPELFVSLETGEILQMC